MRDRIEYFDSKGWIYWYKSKWAEGLYLDLKMSELFKLFCREKRV
jgi:hypothetical protein